MKLTSLPKKDAMRQFAVYGPLAAALAAGLMPGIASAAGTTLIGSASGKCIDVIGGNTNPGTGVQIWGCNNGNNQKWEFTAAGELRTLDGTRCLDAKGQNTKAGTIVTSYTCNGQANQKWQYNNNGTIQGTQSGLCLDVIGASNAEGAGLQIWTCHGNGNQVWTKGAGSGVSDTQAPTVPNNLKIANLACRSVTLSWSGSTDNVGVAFYDIYHDGQALGTVNGNTLSSNLVLTPGASWGLYVNARDAAGNVSQASTSLKITVPQCVADGQAPSTPTGLKGSINGTTANLSWTAATDNIGVASYDIYRNNNKVGNTANTSYTDAGLSANTSYSYTVAARDAQNNVSGRSTSLSLTTGGGCSSVVCSTTQVSTETDIPWGLVNLPDGNILYTRRDAQELVRLNPNNNTKTVVAKIPDVQGTAGEGGLMGLAATSGFPNSDPWLYIMHTTANDNRVIRVKYVNGSLDLGSKQVLLSGILRNKFHNGGRLRFGPDGKLYVATGDAQNGDNAQNTNGLNGKVLRMNPDGSRPSDNPFNNYVWSYGHRNPQGLAFDSQGRLWEQEFGDGTMDETNLIEKGKNYGWPNCEGTFSRVNNGCNNSAYTAPKHTYPTGDGSCSGIAIVRDVLYVACERGQRLYREVISGNNLTNVQQLYNGTYGRLRTVEPDLTGGLWLTTSGNGSVFDNDKDNTPNNSNEKILRITLGN